MQRAAWMLSFVMGCYTTPAPAPAPAPAPRRTVVDLVQPVRIEKAPEHEGEKNGVEGGVEDSPLEAPPPPPPPPPPSLVAPTLLEGQRIAGNAQIAPSDDTKIELRDAGKTRVVATAKLCIGIDGVPRTVALIRSSGYPAYDEKIRSEMIAWRYRPYTINGKAIPVCTAITFIYQQVFAAPTDPS
jgi:hypothetical protein